MTGAMRYALRWRWWRLAWADDDHKQITGYRQIAGRLWWLTAEAVAEERLRKSNWDRERASGEGGKP